MNIIYIHIYVCAIVLEVKKLCLCISFLFVIHRDPLSIWLSDLMFDFSINNKEYLHVVYNKVTRLVTALAGDIDTLPYHSEGVT